VFTKEGEYSALKKYTGNGMIYTRYLEATTKGKDKVEGTTGLDAVVIGSLLVGHGATRENQTLLSRGDTCR
jgi:hypothetical protein